MPLLVDFAPVVRSARWCRKRLALTRPGGLLG